MKKILILVCAMMLGLGFAQAQVHQGETAAGINLVYGSEIESLGLGARFQYGILDQLRAEVGFNGFFQHNHTSCWDVNLNAHYLFPLGDKLKVYPLAGLSFTNWKADLILEWDDDFKDYDYQDIDDIDYDNYIADQIEEQAAYDDYIASMDMSDD